MSQFQSDAGIGVSWPLPSPVLLRLSLAEVGSYVFAPNLKISAAVSITETTPTGKGELQSYVDNVDVRRTAAGIEVSVPTSANALVYGVSNDGRKIAIIDFASSVAGILSTLTSQPGSTNTFLLGDAINYTINRVSNDFTGIYSLRGKYRVTIVINGLSLRKADGSPLPELTVVVPTLLNPNGSVAQSKSVTGPGLAGYITLTD